MTHLNVTILGMPAPQGSKRHVGNGRMVESSKKVAPWRQDVRTTIAAALPEGWLPMDGPVAVTAVFYLPRPTGHPKTRRTYPMRTPDLDKLVRSTFDAMKSAGVWTDDARCVDLTTYKRYAHPDALAYPHELRSPGVVLTIDDVIDDGSSWPTTILCPMCVKHTLTNDLAGRWVCPDCKEVSAP